MSNLIKRWQIKKDTGVIPPFYWILTVEYVYFIHLVIPGHLQDHNVDFKV